jgi:hypothetical protein
VAAAVVVEMPVAEAARSLRTGNRKAVSKGGRNERVIRCS